MSDQQLLERARGLGVSVTSPIHMSYRLDLPEGMSLVTFLSLMRGVDGAGFMVLEKRGAQQYGIPHRTPHAGPFATEEKALAEIAGYAERWPEDDASRFDIFALQLAR